MIDTEALRSWMDSRGLGTGSLVDVRPLAGGTQNIMVEFGRDGRRYILRRGPKHPRPYSNTAILRETRVLAALRGTDVPHARLIDVCDDPATLGESVFYLMEPVDGFNASVELPEPHAHDDAMRRQMAFNLVDAVAALGAVDYVAVGLADFGKPDGFLDRQVPRWSAELASYSSEGFESDIPGVPAVTRWLTEHQPSSYTPGIMHGDYHAANVMFSRTGPDVAAIVDWEMATIGDPLLDLGWLLATWQLPGVEGVMAGPFMASAGLPTPSELVARYGERSTRDLSHMRWYTVLACFKLGILLEGTWARAHAGKAPMEIGRQLHNTTLRLFARATELIEVPA